MEKYKEDEKMELEELNDDVNTISDSKSQKDSSSDEEEEVKEKDKPASADVIYSFGREELVPVASELLLSQKHNKINIRQLIECFKILDKEEKGYIEVEVFKNLISSLEYPFSEEEFESFFKFAVTEKDPNKIFYNEYILDYKEMIKTHIEKLFSK